MEIKAFGASFDGLMGAEQWSQVASAAHLSPREQAVCQHLFLGKTRQQIASSVGISPRTVRQHLEHIHSKLSVTNRVGVVLRIIQIRDGLPQQQSRFAGTGKAGGNGRQTRQWSVPRTSKGSNGK